ncbi:MAG: SWIM zinc finger family protein [Corynebacterium sp.]|uniref:SWIM zinc finger family protein n=1 Tax=Corynebacterium sp. TaxID=1720 RepID=UPI003F0B705D
MADTEFGATLWDRAWLRTVERTDGPPRSNLPKARSLARNHKVDLTGPGTPGAPPATVRDGSSTATVVLNLAPWTEKEAGAAADVLSAYRPDPSGDLPDALLAQLTGAGVSVTPDTPDDTARCTCRARKRPCAHILAAIYALVLQIDERPVTALELRSNGAVPWADDAGTSTAWIPLEEIDAATFFDTPGAS